MMTGWRGVTISGSRATRGKPAPSGTPAWVLTYADLMSLLLGFFILLVSMSEIKDKGRFESVAEHVREAFGMRGGGGSLPTETDPSLSLIERLEALELHQRNKGPQNEGNAQDPGMIGREQSVTRVREGLLFAVGGRVTFAPGSADLTEEGRRQLRRVVELHKLRGTNNVIELRGHASPTELAGQDGRYGDLWDLSFARAKAAEAYLTSKEVGLRPERFRLTANGDREPLVNRAYTAMEQEPNRRVEMIVSESLVSEFVQPEARAGG